MEIQITCRKCGITDVQSKFAKDSSNKKTGVANLCKECDKIRCREYHLKNKDVVAERAKERRIDNVKVCGCGSLHSQLKQARHVKTVKHQEWLKSTGQPHQIVERIKVKKNCCLNTTDVRHNGKLYNQCAECREKGKLQRQKYLEENPEKKLLYAELARERNSRIWAEFMATVKLNKEKQTAGSTM